MNKYWINGNGEFSSIDHWSDTSGGDPSDSLPSSNDVIIIDNNSGNELLTIILDGDIDVLSVYTLNRSKTYNIINDVNLSEKPNWSIRKFIKINEYCVMEPQGDLQIYDNCIINVSNNIFKNIIDENGNVILLDNDIILTENVIFKQSNSVFNIQNNKTLICNTIIPYEGVNFNANNSVIQLNLLNDDNFNKLSFNASGSKVIIKDSGIFNSGNSKFNKLQFDNIIDIKDNIIVFDLIFSNPITLSNTFIRITNDIIGESTIKSVVNSTIDMDNNHIYSMLNIEGINVINGTIAKGQNIQLKNDDSNLFPITLAENVLMKDGDSIGNKVINLQKAMLATKAREQFYAMKLQIANDEGAIVQFDDLSGIDESSLDNIVYDESNNCIVFTDTTGSIQLKEVEVDPYNEIEVELWSDKTQDSNDLMIKAIVDKFNIICDCDIIPTGLKLIINNHVYVIDNITLND